MNRNLLLAAAAVTLLGSAAVLAAQAPQHPMTFFAANTVPGTGNLGGLAGADAICQNLAQSAGAGMHTWHAYLSTQGAGGNPGANARGRIGPGPWYNAKGTMIAANVGDLHGDNQRDRNNIQKANVLTEKGEVVKGFGDMPNEHDMLTGSDSDGRAFPGGFDTTCNNWTSDGTDPGDARPFGPFRRRQYVLEFGAPERRLHQGGPHPDRWCRTFLLLRDQLVYGSNQGEFST